MSSRINKLRRKDLAVAAIIGKADSDPRDNVVVVTDQLTYATDGHAFASCRRPEDNGLSLTIHPGDVPGIVKVLPKTARAKKDGNDYVEVKVLPDGNTGVALPEAEAESLVLAPGGAPTKNLFDHPVGKILKKPAKYAFNVDAELLRRSCHALFDGSGSNRERLGIEVREMQQDGATYPVYRLTNLDDPDRVVILAGIRQL